MSDRSGGLVWKLQLVVFVVVGLDAGRRLAGGVTLDAAGLLNVGLLVLSALGGAYVAWTRRPVSTAFSRPDADDRPAPPSSADDAGPAPGDVTEVGDRDHDPDDGAPSGPVAEAARSGTDERPVDDGEPEATPDGDDAGDRDGGP